jgi:hypothetical protein
MKNSDLIKKRFDTAKQKRSMVESRLDLAYRLVSPSGSPFHTVDTNPDRSRIFDSTALWGRDQLANRVMKFVLPRDQRWMNFCLGQSYKDTVVYTVDEERRLANAQKQFFHAVDPSGLYLAGVDSMKDCITGGVGGVFKNYRDGLRYLHIPLAQLYFLDDGQNRIDIAFRKYTRPAYALQREYGKLPKWISDIIKQNPDEQITLIESMVPGERKNEYCWAVHTEREWDDLQCLDLKYRPITVYRWDRDGADMWGEGPILKALNDIQSANLAGANLLDLGSFMARPTMKTNVPELVNRSYAAGEVVYVPEQTLFEPLFQIPGGNFQIAESTLMRLQASVRQYLFMDVLQGLGDRATSVEVQVRREEYFDNLGSVALRLEEEFLRPVIMSTCSILSDNRKLDLKEIDGQQIIIETNSIEKRVQRERDATRTAQALGVLAQSMEMIQKMGPEAGQTIDAAKTARHLLTNLGFPAECMRTEEEVAAQTKAEQAATVLAGKQQLEMGQASAETAPQVGRAVAGLLPDLIKASQG